MIGIIDYKVGNLGSVKNACDYLNLDARLISSPDKLSDCSALILPGQGAFRDCMQNFCERGFVGPTTDWIAADKPLFGICIGLQILFEGSEECPQTSGLGIFPGKLKKFKGEHGHKVPQMGWNKVYQKSHGSIWNDIDDGAYFYLVHSYYVPLCEAPWVAGTTNYEDDYVSVIQQGNLWATQFHPEKSQSNGLQLLKNFSESV